MIKETVSDEDLFQNCPASFKVIFKHVKQLTYHDVPLYETYKDLMRKDLRSMARADSKM